MPHVHIMFQLSKQEKWFPRVVAVGEKEMRCLCTDFQKNEALPGIELYPRYLAMCLLVIIAHDYVM